MRKNNAAHPLIDSKLFLTGPCGCFRMVKRLMHFTFRKLIFKIIDTEIVKHPRNGRQLFIAVHIFRHLPCNIGYVDAVLQPRSFPMLQITSQFQKFPILQNRLHDLQKPRVNLF